MSDETTVHHPPEFTRLCDEAMDGFRALAAADTSGRAKLIPGVRALLARIDEEIDAMDIRLPGFPQEQGALGDAAMALQSIDIDRGGPHVGRYVERAIADIRRVSG